MHYFRFLTLAALGLSAVLPAGAAKPAASAEAVAALLKSAPTAAQFPNAGAITMRDEQTDHLHTDGSYVEQIHQTIRIFNERGRDQAEFAIPYNGYAQSVTGIQARTIKPNGQVVPVKADDIHESSPFSDYTMYDDAKVIRFSMPGVEDGAIADVAYTVTTTRPTLAGQYAFDWTFQDDSNPVRLSRLTVVAPASLKLQTQTHNAPGLVSKTTSSADGKTKTYVWQMTDLPDRTPEPMMPPGETYQPFMEVSTIPSWQTVSRWYQKLAAPRMAATPEIKALVRQLTAGKTNDTDKARALFYWVESRTRYVALELGLSAYQPHSAAAVCSNRYGDCKDMATLLLSMLHEAGIHSAWPVLLSANDPLPKHDKLASPGTFDHAIVRADVDGKPYWLDCTAELSTFGDIPGGDRGANAFVIRDGAGAFETIPAGTVQTNSMTSQDTVTLHADGSAEGQSTLAFTGDAALGLRAALRSVKPDQLPQVFQSLAQRIGANATVSKYTFTPPNDRDTPMQMTLTYHVPLFATPAGSLLIIPGASPSANGFTLATRHYPLYQGNSTELVQDSTIILPPGYGIQDKPDDLHLPMALGTADITYSVADGAVHLHSVLDDHAVTVSPADYPALKTQMEQMTAHAKEPIVLQKSPAGASKG